MKREPEADAYTAENRLQAEYTQISTDDVANTDNHGLSIMQ